MRSYMEASPRLSGAGRSKRNIEKAKSRSALAAIKAVDLGQVD